MRPASSFSPVDQGYWLAHCEGFRVEEPLRRLGIVEEVLAQPDGGEAVALAVRGGVLGRRLTLVPAHDVSLVVPRAKRVFLRGAGE